MKLNIGNYMITTDDMQFIVQEKKVVQEGRMVKAENVGKERWLPIAYCSNFEHALKILSKRCFVDNEDIRDVVKALDGLSKEIDKLNSICSIKGD